MSGTFLARCALLLATLFGAYAAYAVTAGNATYTYDGVGRLIAVIYENGTGQIYTYDAAGNRQTSYSGAPAILSITPSATVTEGGTVTLTVTRSGAAVATSVNYQTVNGTAVSPTNYTAKSGTLSFLATDTSKQLTVTTVNDSKYDGALNFSVKLTPATPNAAISPTSSLVTINEATAAPSFSISTPAAVNEGSAPSFTITRTGTTSLAQTVSYSTANTSAVAGVDYASTQGSASFAATDTSKSVAVPTYYESSYEGTRKFTMTLSSPSNGATLGTATGTATINDTDPAISFSINSPPAVVEGSGPITFTVTESAGPPGIPFSINYATASGTAVAGTDFTTTTGTLTFPAGATPQTKTISVPTLYGRTENSTRTFTVALSNPTNGAPIGTASGTGSITEITVPVAPTLSPSFYYSTAGGDPLTWTVPPGNPTSYQLWTWSDVNATKRMVYSGTATSKTGAPDTGSNGLDTYFYVLACTANGCSAPSNTATFLWCNNGNC